MMETKFVKIKGNENPEIVELPLEFDNTLSLSVLKSQFPYSTGLKYRNTNNNQIRTVRRTDGKFFLSLDLNWDDFIFFCVCPQRKRKSLHHYNNKLLKHKKPETIKSIYRKFPETFDLMAIGMSFDTTQEDLEKYLNRYGKLMYCMLKFDDVFGYSRGVAFFRFTEIRSQNLCLSATHVVDKTKIIIKVPNEKINVKESQASKLYISNVSNTLTREDIRAYFSQYGQVIHVFMPPDKRCFAFVTFIDDKAIERVLNEGQMHIFNGARVNVRRVINKRDIINTNSVDQKNNFHKRKKLPDNYNQINPAKISKIIPENQSGNNNYYKQYSDKPISNYQLQIKSPFNIPNLSQPPPISFPNITLPLHNLPPPNFNLPTHNQQSAPLHHIPKQNHSSQYFPFTSHPFTPVNNFPSTSYALNNPAQQLTPQYIRNNNNHITEHSPQSVQHSISYPHQDSSHLQCNTFEKLLVKEIISQFNQQKHQNFPFYEQMENSVPHCIENQISGKPHINCSQLDYLVNQVCLLKHSNSKHENLFDLSKLKPDYIKNDLFWILNDPKVHRALEMLQDSRVLDMLIKYSKTDKEKCVSHL